MNSEEVKQYNKRYHSEHREQAKKLRKKYYMKHIKKEMEYNEAYRKEHLEKFREYNKIYCEKHPEKRVESKTRWIKNHSEYNKEYHKNHPEKVIESSRRRRATIQGSIDNRIGPIIASELRGAKRGRSWEILVGYTLEDLKEHLQHQFANGMTWEKFLNGEIHIDHIIPKSHFKYKSTEDSQFKECWALHNLQPLWAKDNLAKGNRNYQIPLMLNS